MSRPFRQELEKTNRLIVTDIHQNHWKGAEVVLTLPYAWVFLVTKQILANRQPSLGLF